MASEKGPLCKSKGNIMNTYNPIYYEQNRKRILANQNKYQQSHKEIVNAKQRRYHAKHREEISRRRKEKYKKNKEKK